MTRALGSVLLALPSPVFVKDEQHRWVLVNDGFCRLLGCDRSQLLGKSDHDFFPKHQAEVFCSSDDLVFSTGGVSENEESLTDSAGHEHAILTRKTLFTDDSGRRLVVGTITEITEREQTAHALKASETRYRRLFEAAKDGILILDASTGKIADVNPFLIDLTRHSREHFLGKQLWEIGLFADIAASKASFDDLKANGFVRYDDLPLRASDGRTIDVEFVSNVYRVDGESVIQCNIRDISGRKKLEEQLRMSQKMEAIGSLAGGVAHDFNNLLSVILSYTEFAMEGLPAGDPRAADLLEVKGAGERAKELTQHLLAFSRKQVLQPVSLSLNQIIGRVAKMLQRVLGEDVELVLALAPDLGLTRADPSQLEQVLMNLVVNARDAMPRGGRLDIETANVEFDEEYAAQHAGVRPGRYVRLSVMDTGSGMDAPTKARIFEPFFTTKETGKGTGLGLSTVYGIISQSGGNVEVYSESGLGTTFKIYLPRDQSTSTAAALVFPALPTRVTGTETILVVEDAEPLLQIARRTLQAAGYTVLVAADGAEALATCAHHLGDLHLLLTDVVMPGMSGGALAREVSRTRPTIKVLFMSGYADETLVHHGVLNVGAHLLGKPFTAGDLRQKVREVLDGPTSGVSPGRE